jgi:hypothetical protein
LSQINGECPSLRGLSLNATSLNSADFSAVFPNVSDISFFNKDAEVIDLTGNLNMKSFTLRETPPTYEPCQSPISLKKIIISTETNPKLANFHIVVGYNPYKDFSGAILGDGVMPAFEGVEVIGNGVFEHGNTFGWSRKAGDPISVLNRFRNIKNLNLKAVQFSNGLTLLNPDVLSNVDGSRRINVHYSSLNDDQLNSLFNMLPDITSRLGTGLIRIYGAPGDNLCNKSIAREKGWRIMSLADEESANRADTANLNNIPIPPNIINPASSRYINADFNFI